MISEVCAVLENRHYQTKVIYYTISTRVCKIVIPFLIKVELNRLSNKLLKYVRNMLMQ